MWENVISVLITAQFIMRLRACLGICMGLGILLLTGCQTLPTDSDSLSDVSLTPLASPVLPSEDSRRSLFGNLRNTFLLNLTKRKRQ